jgi:putative endonuclease
MFKVYVLESIKTKKWYIGFTPSDVIKRLNKHNNGEVVSTKSFRPWRLIYYESYLNRNDATGREKFLKSGAGRSFLKKQLKNYLSTRFTACERSELYAGD